MLIKDNENSKQKGKVEFVSYTGKYPSLCMGVLTLKINGIKYTFGNKYNCPNDFPKFWASGGNCGFTNEYEKSYINTGEWLIYESEIPEEFKMYATEIDEVFNFHIPYGCCGGCL